jgi:hypothetical protein
LVISTLAEPHHELAFVLPGKLRHRIGGLHRRLGLHPRKDTALYSSLLQILLHPIRIAVLLHGSIRHKNSPLYSERCGNFADLRDHSRAKPGLTSHMHMCNH